VRHGVIEKSYWQAAKAEDIKVSGLLLSLMTNKRFAFDKLDRQGN